MKKAIFITFILLCGQHIVVAQTGAIRQVYAWAQPVLGGARPSGNAVEGGGEIHASGSKYNYLFFAACRPNAKTRWNSIWIQGIPYQVKADSVTGVPVLPIEEGSDGQRLVKELVPENAGPVIQLLPGKSLGKAGPRAAWFRNMIKGNELVIVYIYMGKTWYYALPKIKMLDAVPAS